MMTPEQIRESADFNVPVMFAPGDATVLQTGLGNGVSAALGRGLGLMMGMAGMVAALMI